MSAREASDREKVEAKAVELLDQFARDPDRLADCAAKYWLAASQKTAGEIWVSPLVNPKGEPLVQVQIDEAFAQLDPDTAREIAGTVNEAAANAVVESTVYRFFLDQFDEETALRLLRMLRERRGDRWGAGEDRSPKAGG